MKPQYVLPAVVPDKHVQLADGHCLMWSGPNELGVFPSKSWFVSSDGRGLDDVVNISWRPCDGNRTTGRADGQSHEVWFAASELLKRREGF